MKKKNLIGGIIVSSCLVIGVSYSFLVSENETKNIVTEREEYAENPLEILGSDNIAFTVNGESTNLSYSELMSEKEINKITCQNGTKAEWDSSANSITLREIKMPDYCTIDFKEGYKVAVDIPNGTVTTTNPVEVGHEGTAIFTVKANDGYTTEGATVSGTGCTISGNTVTAQNVTSTRTCVVTLVPIKYTVTINVINGYSSPSSIQSTYGKEETFTIYPNTGYEMSGAIVTGTGCSLSGDILTISKVVSDITCTVTIKTKKMYTVELKIVDRSGNRYLFSNGTTTYSTTATHDGSAYVGIYNDNGSGKPQSSWCSGCSNGRLNVYQDYSGILINNITGNFYGTVVLCSSANGC